MGADGGRRTGLGVGDAARAAATTVRTLQHYDRIGLLRVGRDGAGRRVYTTADLARLQQIALLTSLGLPLAEVRRVVDREDGHDPVRAYALQVELCERRELGLRAQRTVLEAVVRVLRRHPGITVPEEALTALMDVERTLLRYPAGDEDVPAALAEHGTSWHLEVYFRWKAVSVEALLLAGAGVAAGSPSGVLLGEHWQDYLTFALGEEPDPRLTEAYGEATDGAGRWPPADARLHDATKEYVERCHHEYLARAVDAGS